MENPNLITTKIPSHIRAYCAKEDLQKKLFNTNIKVYAFDSKPINKEDSIVVLVYKTSSELEIIKKRLAGFIDTNGTEFRGIMVDVLADGDERLEQYKNGDL